MANFITDLEVGATTERDITSLVQAMRNSATGDFTDSVRRAQHTENWTQRVNSLIEH